VKQSMQVLEWQAEAEKRATAKSLLTVLSSRFDTAVPAELEARIRGTEDLTQLERWLKAAARATSLEEFCQTVNP
jgi:hypothetical protein